MNFFGKLALGIALLVAVVAYAQDAKVFKLTPKQQQTAKSLYEAKVKADKEWTEFDAGIAKEFAQSKVVYTEDFEFALPDGYVSSSISRGGCWNGGSYTLNPAVYHAPHTGLTLTY